MCMPVCVSPDTFHSFSRTFIFDQDQFDIMDVVISVHCLLTPYAHITHIDLRYVHDMCIVQCACVCHIFRFSFVLSLKHLIRGQDQFEQSIDRID